MLYPRISLQREAAILMTAYIAWSTPGLLQLFKWLEDHPRWYLLGALLPQVGVVPRQPQVVGQMCPLGQALLEQPGATSGPVVMDHLTMA